MSVEVKSVNHRYLDVHIKIPSEYQSFENVVRQKVSGAFKRGRIDAFVRIDYKRENIKLDVNHALIQAYVDMMSKVKAAYSIQGDVTLELLTRLPGLVSGFEQRLVCRRVGFSRADCSGNLRRRARPTPSDAHDGGSGADGGYRSQDRQHRPSS